MRDGVGKCRDLILEHGGGRHVTFEDGNKDRQFGSIDKGLVFRILVTLERPQTYPGLTAL